MKYRQHTKLRNTLTNLKHVFESYPVTVLHISQNFIMARFAEFDRSKLHQILKTASILP